MTRINLHDYRYELRRIEIQKRAVKCSAAIIAVIFLIFLSWLVEKNRLGSIKSEINKAKSQVTALQNQVKMINAMEMKQSRMEAIISEIEGMSKDKIPTGTIVSDLNMLIPAGLWLVSIIQKDTNDLRLKNIPVIMFNDPNKKNKKEDERKKGVKEVKEFMEVSGYALNEKEVVQYIQKLQQISYYETTFLYKTTRSILGGQPVYKFIIYCYMPGEKKTA